MALTLNTTLYKQCAINANELFEIELWKSMQNKLPHW